MLTRSPSGEGTPQGGHTTTCPGRLIRAASIAALLAAGAPATLASAQTDPAPGPSVSFASGPQDPAPTNDPTPTFRFSASDPMAGFECSMDGALPESCGSPYTPISLGDGPHRLQVRAIDAIRTPGEWTSRDFTVDTSVPEVAYTDGPDGPTRARRPSFAFASAPGSSFECRLDELAVGCLAGAFAPGGDLGEGPHLLVVRATNAFRSDEAEATFECSLDGSSFSSCGSPWVPGPLDGGPHRIAVRALDPLGNADATPATADFTVGGSTPSGRTEVGTGVRMLAERLVLNLDMTVGRIRETEMPTVLRQGAVRVEGIRSLVPGTLSVIGRARAARGQPIVLRGSVTLDADGSGTLALRPTDRGRALIRRGGSVPLVVAARFTMQGLVLSAAEKATLVRDWITPDEARRAVLATLRRSHASGAKNPSVEIGARCGSGCLAVRAEWFSQGGLWSARGRARQVAGRVRVDLAEAVRQNR